MTRILLALLLSGNAITFQAQIDPASDLYLALQKQDSVFFERAFNKCDFEYLEQSVSDDLRFYHDQSGFQDRNTFIENIKKYICSNPEKKPIRKLEMGSLIVFPLHNNGILYGAIQNGKHHFYIRQEGKEDVWTSTARFTHVWILDNKTWKLSIVLSYDH